MQLQHIPFAIIILGASGVGKGSLIKKLLQKFPSSYLSISATTRDKRPSEVDGKDYLFYTKEKFLELIDNNGLFEWAEVFGNYYGSPKDKVFQAFDEGKNVIFDIDWQGARQIKESLKDRAITIHILPPSVEDLRDRLVKRAEDSIEVIDKRMSKAFGEIEKADECDYVILNDDIDVADEQIYAIIIAEMQRRKNIANLGEFIDKFK